MIKESISLQRTCVFSNAKVTKKTLECLVVKLLLFVCFMGAFTGCQSMKAIKGYSPEVISFQVQERIHVHSQKLKALALALQQEFEDPAEQVHFANEHIRQCDQFLALGEALTEEERDAAMELLRGFERKSFEGQAYLARDVFFEEVQACDKMVTLGASMDKLVLLLGKMSERSELWEYDELHMILSIKAEVETERKTLDKYYDECLKAQNIALEELRRIFENKTSSEYMNHAENLYARQKGKWFNWKWLGCWRDDMSAIYLAADYCQRVIEGKYVSSIPYNRASELLSTVLERCSGEEYRFYKESHRNSVTAMELLSSYPRDQAKELAEIEALQHYREHRIGEKKEDESVSLPLRDISAR